MFSVECGGGRQLRLEQEEQVPKALMRRPAAATLQLWPRQECWWDAVQPGNLECLQEAKCQMQVVEF